jgi:hypothetical protein
LTEAIVCSARDSIPIVTSKQRIKSVPYWSRECDQAIKTRNRAQKKARFTKDIGDANNFRKLRGIAQRVIKTSSKTYWENYCTTLNKDTKLSGVWRMTKKMTGNKSQFTIPTLIKDGKAHTSNLDKSNLLGSYLAEASSNKNYSQAFTIHKQTIENEYKSRHPITNNDDSINESFSLDELVSAIKQSKNQSAA